MNTVRIALLSSLLALAACEPPPVVRAIDEREKAPSGRIEGTLVVSTPARGNVVVFLYDASAPGRLPPPIGAGRPVSFALVPAEKLFGAALLEAPDTRSTGPFTAPFAFDLVPPGRYHIRGFVDADGCLPVETPGCRRSDWLPWYGVTSEPNFGDVGGAMVEPTNPTVLRFVDVPGEEGPDGTVRGKAVTGITLPFVDAPQAKPPDRPVFKVELQVGDIPSFNVANKVKVVTLRPHAVSGGVVQTHAMPGNPAIYVQLADANRDGAPDTDKDGNLLVEWPKLLVRKLDTAGWPVTEENDLDRNGILDAEGVEYTPLVGAPDGKPDRVVLAAAIRITPDLLDKFFYGPDGKLRLTPVPVTDGLPVAIAAMAVDIAGSAQVPLKSVPVGMYSLLLLQSSGQTWRVPNELAPSVAQVLGLPADPTQDFTLQVQ